MSDTAIAPLRVANEAFLVSSMIERCPKTMMIRELVVNGLEAAEHAPPGDRRVVIGARRLWGARKLCLWNTGPGLTADELLRITDLASSIRKENSLERNFGMGAKVASLPSNRHGLRYRSCTAGRVSEVTLGYRDGVYGRLRTGPERAEVIDATESCRAEGGYDLAGDWTEVLLCGNVADQDTAAAPYGGAPAVQPLWLRTYLENRFFRLPPGVSLVLMPGSGDGDRPRAVTGLGSRGDAFTRMETRSTPSGVRIHYGYAAPGPAAAARDFQAPPSPEPGRAALVFRNEIYDLRADEAWLQDAPTYGVPFGARHISIFVELPDDYLVLPEVYRQFLRFRGNEQRQVFLAEFAALVRTHLPAWLAAIIRGFGPRQASYLGEISEELAALLAALEVAPRLGAPGAGLSLATGATAAEKTPPAAGPVDVPPPPAEPPRSRPRQFERPPEIIGLRDAAMIRERGLEGRAARFYPQSHQIFINLGYPAVSEMAARLMLEHGARAPADEESVRRAAVETAEWCLTLRVTRALVYSLAKKDLGWRPDEIARAQSTESLSLIADDWFALMEAALLRFRSMTDTPQPQPTREAPPPQPLRTVAA